MALWRTLIMEIGFRSLSLSLFCFLFLFFSLNSNRTRASSSNLTNSKWWASFANLSGEQSAAQISYYNANAMQCMLQRILCQPKIEVIIAFIVSSFQAHGITYLGPTSSTYAEAFTLAVCVTWFKFMSLNFSTEREIIICHVPIQIIIISIALSHYVYICLWLLNVLAKCSQHGIKFTLLGIYLYNFFEAKISFEIELPVVLKIAFFQ